MIIIKRNLFILCTFSILLLLTNQSSAVEKKAKLVGKINEATGQYNAVDDSFQVTVPVSGTRAYVLNTVTDIFTARGTVLSIKPTKKGGTYRLEISHAVDKDDRETPFAQASATALDWYRRLATRSYKSPLVEINTRTFELDGKQSIAAIYKQFATDSQGPRFHLFYLTDFGNKLAFVWTDIPLPAENISTEEEIITGRAEQVKKSIAMLRSLTFN